MNFKKMCVKCPLETNEDRNRSRTLERGIIDDCSCASYALFLFVHGVFFFFLNRNFSNYTVLVVYI
jgi:hypothetical protein